MKRSGKKGGPVEASQMTTQSVAALQGHWHLLLFSSAGRSNPGDIRPLVPNSPCGKRSSRHSHGYSTSLHSYGGSSFKFKSMYVWVRSFYTPFEYGR